MLHRTDGLERAIATVFDAPDSPFTLREFTDRVNALLAADADDPLVVRHYADREAEAEIARERDIEALDPWRDVKWSDEA